MSKIRRTNLKAEPLIETSTVPTETYPGVGYETDPSVHAPKVPDLKKPEHKNPDKGFLREVEEDAGLDDMVLTQPIRYIVDPKDAIDKMEALNRKVEESRPELAPQVEVVDQAIKQLEDAANGNAAPAPEAQAEVPAFNEGDRVSVTLEDGVYEGMVEKANEDGTFAVRTDQAMTLQNVPATSMQKAEVQSMTLPASLRMRLQAARMITDAIAEAFMAGKKRRIANTSTDGQTVWLHNNPIARKTAGGDIEVSLAGWPTATTRERINGILNGLGIDVRVSQRGGAQMLNGKPWDGEWQSVGKVMAPSAPVDPSIEHAPLHVKEGDDVAKLGDEARGRIKKQNENLKNRPVEGNKVKAAEDEDAEMETCQDCGTELDPEKGEVFLTDDGGIYCNDCMANHEGEGDDENREPDSEVDIIIGDDDLSAYYAGKEIVSITRDEADADEDALEKAVAAWMDENKFWPDVFTVSDHGNSNLVTERFSKFTKGAKGDEESVKAMLGLSAGSSWYVGHKGGKAEAFQSDEEPTETSHPQYGAVTGPFKTEQGARYGADYKGPILQHVDEFEEAAHREGMVAMAAKKKSNKVKAAEPTNTTQTGSEKGKVKSGYEPTGIQVVEEGGKPRAFDPAKDDVVPAELYKNEAGKFALVNPNGENTYEEGANDELEFSYWASIKSLATGVAAKPAETAPAPAPEPAKTEQKPTEAKEAVAASAKATAAAARAKVKAAKAKPAPEVKASAFDEIPEIELGGGFKAKRKAGKEAKDGEEAMAAEIEVVDADGKVKATYPDAFGDDTVTIIKFLRQVLDIKEGDDKAAAKKEDKGEKKGEGGESDIAEKPKALPAVKDPEPKKETEKEEEQLATKRMEARMENIRLIAVRLLRSGHIQANLDEVDDGLVKGLTLAGAQEAAAKKAVDRKVLDLLAQPEDELLLIKASLPLLEDRRVTVQASDGGLGPINLSAGGVIDVSGKQDKGILGAAFGRGFQRR